MPRDLSEGCSFFPRVTGLGRCILGFPLWSLTQTLPVPVCWNQSHSSYLVAQLFAKKNYQPVAVLNPGIPAPTEESSELLEPRIPSEDRQVRYWQSEQRPSRRSAEKAEAFLPVTEGTGGGFLAGSNVIRFCI